MPTPQNTHTARLRSYRISPFFNWRILSVRLHVALLACSLSFINVTLLTSNCLDGGHVTVQPSESESVSVSPSCKRDLARTDAFMAVFCFQERRRTEQLRASVRVHADCRTPLPDPPDPPDPSQQTRPLGPDAEQPPGDP